MHLREPKFFQLIYIFLRLVNKNRIFLNLSFCLAWNLYFSFDHNASLQQTNKNQQIGILFEKKTYLTR